MRHTARLIGGSFFLLASTTLLAQAPPAPVTPPPAVGPVAAAPAAAAAPTGEYFPMKAGAKWVYKVGEALVTVKIASSDKDGTKVETEVNGKVVASELLVVTPEGIVRTKINNSPITPPVMILTPPQMTSVWSRRLRSFKSLISAAVGRSISRQTLSNGWPRSA